jgi:hypothetical protein
MKRLTYPKLRLLLVAYLALQQFSVFAQDSTQLQIVSPFDSVTLSNVKAIGNLQTGSIEVTIQVLSKYHKLTNVNFGGAGFADLGVTDDKGVKYKYSSYDGPPGLSNGINKGYSQMTDLQLGKSKALMIISVQDTFHTGQSETLRFRLVKADKTVKTLKEVHLLCALTLDYMSAGQKQYYIKDIPVEWFKPKPKVAGKR